MSGYALILSMVLLESDWSDWPEALAIVICMFLAAGFLGRK